MNALAGRLRRLESRLPPVLVKFIDTGRMLARGEKPTPGTFTFSLDDPAGEAPRPEERKKA